MIYLQTLEVTDITSLTSLKEISINGILFLALYIIWKENSSLKEDLKTLRKERDEEKDKERDKYYDIIVKQTEIINENNRLLRDVQKVLDK